MSLATGNGNHTWGLFHRVPCWSRSFKHYTVVSFPSQGGGNCLCSAWAPDAQVSPLPCSCKLPSPCVRSGTITMSSASEPNAHTGPRSSSSTVAPPCARPWRPQGEQARWGLEGAAACPPAGASSVRKKHDVQPWEPRLRRGRVK